MFFRRKKVQQEPAKKKGEKLAKDMGFPDLSEIGMASDEAIQNILGGAVQSKAPVPASVKGAGMDSAVAGALPAPTFGAINQRTLAYYVASSSFIGYFPCALIAQHWLVSKGCSFKAREAVKKWFTITASDGSSLPPEQVKIIERKDTQYKLRQNLIEAVHFNNVFGIRHILFKHKNPDFDYEKPFNPDSFGPNEYAGMSQIDPYWITPEINDDDLTDPTRIGFYDPTYWLINGKRYHKSHFAILRGDDVADYLKPSYRYGGIPLVQKVYERIYAGETTANEGPQLAKTKRLLVQKVDAAEIQANLKKFINNLNVFQKMRDNYGTRFVGKNDEVQQIDTALTDLDSTIMTQYQLVCSIFDTPASKLLGTGHQGFSTGETDDDYYIQSVEEIQGNDMTTIIEAHYRRLVPSELKPRGIESSIEPVWNPIKVISEKEKSDILLNTSTALGNLVNTGAIDAIDVQDYLTKQKDLGFEGIKERSNEIIDEDDYLGEQVSDDGIDPSKSLNGAQVTAMTGLIEKITSGEMKKSTAIKVMTASFPVSEGEAKNIVADVIEPEENDNEKDQVNQQA